MKSPTDTKSESPVRGNTEWLTSKHDGSEHFLRLWQAESPTAFILYLHGIEGHSLWFEDTALFLQENGISTVALDRRGSGMSKEDRGDTKDWQLLLSDVSQTISHVKNTAGSKPLFLMANCWGAKIATLLTERQRAESKLVAGLILSSPAIEVKVDLPLAEKLKVAWRLSTGDRRSVPIPVEVKDFTDNPHYLKFIEQDSLRLTEATPHFFINTLILTMLSKRSAEKIDLPTLIVQSGIDSIVETNGVRGWFNRLNSPDKTFQIFDKAYHSLDFHSESGPYRQLLLKWILDRKAEQSN